MNSRRYIGALIIVLTFLGVVYQQQNTPPNQEIVLQFTDVEVTSVETQNTIALVKEQLQNLGADNIQVKKTEEGILKITYYSATNVSYIKRSLSEENVLTLNGNLDNQDREPSNLTIENSSISYNLNVYEIQNGNDTDWNFVENSILQIKSDNERLLNPNVFVSVIELDNKEENSYKVAYKISRNIALAIDNMSHNIPEVRAGPIS
ncbi:MAG: hypothetical protein KDC81_13195 [Flavobacteriaceae bacterium]|nr:hypothetical protein [Flavobacteriaceae bacterium]